MCCMYIQRQEEEEVNKLTSELAMKEKEIIRLKDDNKVLSRKVSESKQSVEQPRTIADKVHTYVCIRICMYLL